VKLQPDWTKAFDARARKWQDWRTSKAVAGEAHERSTDLRH